MKNSRRFIFSSVVLSLLSSITASIADTPPTTAAQGDFSRTTRSTSNQSGNKYSQSYRTGRQSAVLQPTSTALLSGRFGVVGLNFLPPTRLDSFVTEAKENAELIYGDEGTDGPPPYFEFSKEHRIERGITGVRKAGLTSGFSSYLPDAWGGDEWVKGPEFDTSGSGRAGIAASVFPAPSQTIVLPTPTISNPAQSFLPSSEPYLTDPNTGF